MAQRKSLGRGLGALIPQKTSISPGSKSVLMENKHLNEENEENEVKSSTYKQIFFINVKQLLPSSAQPRQIFDDSKIDELSKSILKHGVLQPIVARKISNERYEIIAGERRWRATQKAGLSEIPTILIDKSDEDVLAIALVENIQRQDLNVIEEAEAYQRLIKKLGYSQEEVATAVGKSRSAISNTLRLLKLPKDVRELVMDDLLSMGHARAILACSDEKKMNTVAQKIINDKWSVRDTENFIRFGSLEARVSKSTGPEKRSGKKYNLPETKEERDVRLRLQKKLGTKVDLHHIDGQGYFRVHFSSYDELDAVMKKIEA